MSWWTTPQLVVLGAEILQDILERAKLTESDLRQSLRQAAITRRKQVEAVVMERDGSISVLRSDLPVDPYLLNVAPADPQGRAES